MGGAGGSGTLGGLAGVGCSSYSVSSGQNGFLGQGGLGGNVYNTTSALGGVGGGGGGGYYGGGGGGAGSTGVSSCTNTADGGGGGGGASGTSYISSVFTNTVFYLNSGVFQYADGLMYIKYASPTLSTSVTSTLACNGASVGITATGTSMSYSWSTGATSSSIVVSPTTTTTYSLFAANGSTCAYTRTFVITAGTSPSLSISASASSVCPGHPVTLSANGASTFTWSGGVTDGWPFIPSSASVYTVTSQNICGTGSATVFVGLYPLPTLSIAGASSLCLGASITLTASGANTYTWSNSATSVTTTITPAINACYSVTGTNSNGCVNTAVWCGTVTPLQSLSIAGSNTLCVGSAITLSVSGANTYTWSDSSTSSSILVSPTTNTCYSVNGTDLNGCVGSTSWCGTVITKPSISIMGNQSICPGSLLTLVAIGANTYSWSNTFTTSLIVVSPLSNTCYSVTGTDLAGCSNTNNICISMLAAPVLTVVGTNSLCLGSSATFSAFGGDTYTWSTSANTSTIVVAPLASTAYTVHSSLNNSSCVTSSVISLTMVNCNIVGISELKDSERILHLFPNPTGEFLTLSSDEDKQLSYSIFDIMGRELMRNTFQKNETVNVVNFEDGVYTISVNVNNRIYFYKLIISK